MILLDISNIEIEVRNFVLLESPISDLEATTAHVHNLASSLGEISFSFWHGDRKYKLVRGRG